MFYFYECEKLNKFKKVIYGIIQYYYFCFKFEDNITIEYYNFDGCITVAAGWQYSSVFLTIF